MRVFAFLDLENIATAWATMRGVLVSADLVPGSPQAFASFMFAGLVTTQNNRRLNNECLLEFVRAQRFHSTISRLRGMYFFKTRELAQHAIDQRWGGHFTAGNLVELELAPTAIATDVDANWITDAPLQADGRIDRTDLSWIDNYWAGTPKSHSPTWETIVRGKAIIVDPAIVSRAYETVQRRLPENSIFIEMARLGGLVGSDAGLITPFIGRLSQDRFRLSYALRNEEFHDRAVAQKMVDHPESKLLREIWPQQPTFKILDLGSTDFDISSELLSEDVGAAIVSVHQ